MSPEVLAQRLEELARQVRSDGAEDWDRFEDVVDGLIDLVDELTEISDSVLHQGGYPVPSPGGRRLCT